ncbi:MAG: histidine--tRNA ligase, partial [Methanobrevibacter sp.]|nr:histidine--tRNA ligase [Methanobrevibacter sp.]
ELALRPEITAPVARLYINELQKTAKPIKLYYFGSCFRYERPQNGRFRQFWQFGCELIGAKSPEAEAEIIAMAENSLKRLKINKELAEIHINHLGIIRGLFDYFNISEEIQEEIMVLIDKGDKELLENELFGKTRDSPLIEDQKLSEILLKLIDLVGKEEIIEKVETIIKDILIKDHEETKSSLNEFKQLIKLLKSFEVENYKINLGIARGLDYYTGIVFEIYVPALESQKQIAGGGTYDLVQLFGGEPVESTGFAFGFDRLMNAIEWIKQSKQLDHMVRNNTTNTAQNNINSIVDVYVAPINDETRAESFEIVQLLRKNNISSEVDLSRKKFKKLLNTANKLNVKYVILVGKDELDKDSVTIKNMANGKQDLVAINEIIDYLENIN